MLLSRNFFGQRLKRHAFNVLSNTIYGKCNVLNAFNYLNLRLFRICTLHHLSVNISFAFLPVYRCGRTSIVRPILNMSTPMPSFKATKYRWVNQNFQKPMDQDRLVWVDLEMTGLDIENCHIIEIACIITDGELNIIEEGPNIVIHQSEEILEAMNDWCKDHHGKSGLTEASAASKISLKAAEMEVLSFVRKHTPARKCPLAGNTVHADKEFLVKYMPDLMEHLHYRIVDVSTVKELCRRWYPVEYKEAFNKKSSHRALDDIKESIEELKHYRKTIFK